MANGMAGDTTLAIGPEHEGDLEWLRFPEDLDVHTLALVAQVGALDLQDQQAAVGLAHHGHEPSRRFDPDAEGSSIGCGEGSRLGRQAGTHDDRPVPPVLDALPAAAAR